MTLIAFAAVAAMMVGQQGAPLVSQRELPAAAVQRQAPAENGRQAVQPAEQGTVAQQHPPQDAPVITPVRPPDKEAARKNEARGATGKRVVAFWVILPEKPK